MWKTLPVTPLQCAELGCWCAEICQRFELYVTVCSLVEMPRFSKDENYSISKRCDFKSSPFQTMGVPGLIKFGNGSTRIFVRFWIPTDMMKILIYST